MQHDDIKTCIDNVLQSTNAQLHVSPARRRCYHVKNEMMTCNFTCKLTTIWNDTYKHPLQSLNVNRVW